MGLSSGMRNWAGASTLALVDFGLALAGVIGERWPEWITAPLGVLTLTAIALTLPSPYRSHTEAIFIRGDASGSRLEDVIADDTDVFIGGNAVGTVLRNIRFNAGPAATGWGFATVITVLVISAAGLLVALLVRL